MFCPRCGQQAAEEVSFCSRCGLALGAVAGVVESGGELARPEAGVGLTPRQRGTRKGLMIIAGGLVFLVIVALLMLVKEDFFPLLILGGALTTVGVMRMLYGLLLEGHAPASEPRQRVAELTRGQAHAAELPPARAVPVSAYAKPGAQTSDMAAPSSVTESTTKLLDEDAHALRRENLR